VLWGERRLQRELCAYSGRPCTLANFEQWPGGQCQLANHAQNRYKNLHCSLYQISYTKQALKLTPLAQIACMIPKAVDTLVEMNVLSYVSGREVGLHANSIRLAFNRDHAEIKDAEVEAKANGQVVQINKKLGLEGYNTMPCQACDRSSDKLYLFT
jgi:hypothetical protein